MSEEPVTPAEPSMPAYPADPVPGVSPAPAGGAAGPAAASAVFADEDDEPVDVAAYFDPDYGPPEGPDAWLARVPSPVADEYLAAHQPAAGAREALAAGFTHRDPVPGGRGWAGRRDIGRDGAGPGAGRIR